MATSRSGCVSTASRLEGRADSSWDVRAQRRFLDSLFTADELVDAVSNDVSLRTERLGTHHKTLDRVVRKLH